MRRIFLTMFVSLDGVMEDPHLWHFPYMSEEMGAYKLEETFATDALLLGRVTYEGFAEAWPGRTDEAGFADRFNSMPKYVVSTTLKNPSWNNSHVISEDVVENVRRLKEEPGQDIAIHGSATLVKTLMEANLIDEYRLMVHPLVLGEGRRLFEERPFRTSLTLTKMQPMPNGVVVLTYAPEPDSGSSADASTETAGATT